MVIDILDEPIEHKKMMDPYVPPQVEPAHVIEIKTKQDDDLLHLRLTMIKLMTPQLSRKNKTK